MGINKHILLIGFMLLLSVSVFGQTQRKKVVLSTGDTVLVVKTQNFLTPEDLKFLRKDSLSKEKIMNLKSDYNSLEAAALDLEKLLSEVQTSQTLTKPNNESLSVRIANRNLKALKNEKNARNTWDSIMAKEPTVEELTALYAEFGDKPSYFINGVFVDPALINRLRSSEILSRNLRTIDTATGNPNGEVWYEVTEGAVRRLGIMEDSLPASETPVTIEEKMTPVIIKEAKPDVQKNSGDKSVAPVPATKSEPVKTEKVKTETKVQEVKQKETKVVEQPKEDDSPKRSVRKIKERQRNK